MSAPPSNDAAEVTFLMEQLLDEQEKVAQLQEELARWKGAAELKHAVESGTMLKASVESSSLSDVNFQTLLSLRDSLTSSLKQIEKDIFRHAASTASSATTHRHDHDDALASLRHVLLRFRSVGELEQLYRTGIRIGHDVPRTMRLAMDRVLQLTNQWSIFHEADLNDGGDALQQRDAPDQPNGYRAPSFCLKKEWYKPFIKAMTELVIAVDMKGNAKLPQAIWENLRDVVAHENQIILLLGSISAANAEDEGSGGGAGAPVLHTSARTQSTEHTQRPATGSSGSGANGGRSNSSDKRQRDASATAAKRLSERTRSSSPKLKPTLQSIVLPNKTAAAPPRCTSGMDTKRPTAPMAARTSAGSTQAAEQWETSHVLPQADASSLLPPRAPQMTHAVNHTVCVEPAVVVAPRSRRVDPATPPSARFVEGKPAALSGARGISPVGRSTPSSMTGGSVQVPRRIALKSPSPKALRRPHSGDDSAERHPNVGSSAAAAGAGASSTAQIAESEDDAAWDAFVEQQERLHVGSAIKATQASPARVDTSATTPKLSAEHTARRREPQATHTACFPPMCDTHAVLKQVRFYDESE